MELRRYIKLYDEAAKEFLNACKVGVSSRTWKKRLEWLDKKLAEHGETYMEKEA